MLKIQLNVTSSSKALNFDLELKTQNMPTLFPNESFTVEAEAEISKKNLRIEIKQNLRKRFAAIFLNVL